MQSRLNYCSLYDKEPFGAVPEGTPIILNTSVEGNVPVRITLRLFHDGEKEAQLFSFKPFGQEGFYRCQFVVDKAGLYFYDFLLEEDDRTCLRFGHHLHYTTTEQSSPPFQLTVYRKEFETPSWCKGSIMYQIFPDRFARSKNFSPLPILNKRERVVHTDWSEEPDSFLTNEHYSAKDFYMGNLKGIEEKTDYLKELNVDVLYLNPIFESSDNHRYCTGDFYKIDGFLGSNEDFLSLTSNLSNQGVRLILDGVFNHAGWDSKYFNRFGHYPATGAYQSESSPYRSWFLFEEYPQKYVSWWGFENLPNFDKNNPEYLEYITNEKNGVLSYWQNYGISGWRLDVADELPDHFLEKIRNTIKGSNKENLLIGEVWEDASNKESYGKRRRYLLGNQLDSVMNYPWRKAIIDFVKGGDASSFTYALTSILENYPKPSIDSLMNILSTHDTNRIISELGVLENIDGLPKNYRLSPEEFTRGKERITYASFLQFTLPGIACIYYGDEVGSEGMTDPFNRRTYPYGREDIDLLNHYRSLCRFRREYRENFSSDIDIVFQQGGCIAYRRGSLLCCLNMGENAIFVPYHGLKEIVFTNKSPSVSEWGIVLPPKSFQSILIENDK